MKTKIFAGIIALTAFLSFTSCDPCADTNCMNGGTCDNGTCNCPDGFAGPSCESTVTFFDYLSAQPAGCIPGYHTDFELLISSVGNNMVHLTYTCTHPATEDIVALRSLTGSVNGNTITFNSVTPTDSTGIWITSGTAQGLNPNYAEGIFYYNNVNYNFTWKKGSQTGTCSGTLHVAAG